MIKLPECSAVSIPALYIHIPFCRKVCPFCSFAVMRDNPKKHAAYLNMLQKELELVEASVPLDFSQITSVYLGGGTPSSLDEDSLETLLNWLKTRLGISSVIDWCIEVNPEDITEPYAHQLHSLGFTRVSVGIQSFNDEQLVILTRQHRTRQARFALDQLKEVGIENVNIDLMFGYPGQNMQSLNDDLDEVIARHTNHVSVYSLTIEPSTSLYRKSSWKNWISENESLIVEMYHLIVDRLAAEGILQYEVSNFSRPGYESTQNLIYWQNQNYIGLGTGAHSHCDSLRWGNVRRLVDYKTILQQDKRPYSSLETLDAVMTRDEDLMLGLRLKKGLDLAVFASKHGIEFPTAWHAKVDQFLQNYLLEESSTHLVLSTNGMLLADEISSILAAALE